MQGSFQVGIPGRNICSFFNVMNAAYMFDFLPWASFLDTLKLFIMRLPVCKWIKIPTFTFPTVPKFKKDTSSSYKMHRLSLHMLKIKIEKFSLSGTFKQGMMDPSKPNPNPI